ncbi:DUF4278 domain-containing protein [Leptolyngbyaceae cyanobacterium UHCC 1019]
MKLAYRGIVYTSVADSYDLPTWEVVGKYRGQSVIFNKPMRVTQPHAVTQLNYRGVPYIRVR